MENNGWETGGGRDFHLIMFCLGQRSRQKLGISPGPVWVLVCIFKSLKYIDPKFCSHYCRFVGFLLSFHPYWVYILSNSEPEVTSFVPKCTKPVRLNDWNTALWNKSFLLPHFLSTWHKVMTSPQSYYIERYNLWKKSWASLLSSVTRGSDNSMVQNRCNRAWSQIPDVWWCLSVIGETNSC